MKNKFINKIAAVGLTVITTAGLFTGCVGNTVKASGSEQVSVE